MRAPLPHVANRLVLVFLAPLLLAACEPSWQGKAPVTRGAAAQSACPGSVAVYPGDTLYSVARRCNVSVRDLIESNDLQPPYQLHAGMVLKLPGGAADYVVQKGDTLLVVARRLKVDFQTLARINNRASPYTIYVGEKLRLPGSFTTATAAAPAGSGSGSMVIASPNAPGGGQRPSPAAPPPREPQLGQPPAQPPAQPQAEMRHAAFQPQQSLPQVPPAMGKGFVWPVRGEVVAEYGPMAKGQHNDGINIAAPKGSAVRAAENGVVAYVGNELKGFGNLLLVKHADGWITAYAHLDQLQVRKGEAVRRGQPIATIGSSGSATSPQLHFEMRRGTEAVNPLDHLKGDSPVS